MTNLRDLIVAADDRKYEDVEVPEWGNVKIRVCGLSGTERDAFEAKMVSVRSNKDVDVQLHNHRSKLLVKCLLDPETDQRIFGDNEVNALGAKSGAVLDRLHDIAVRLSGMDEDAPARAEGNSEADPSAASTTG